MINTRLFIVTIITILIAGNILLGVLYFLNRAEIGVLQQQFTAQQTNGKVAFFAKLFVDKVLLGQGTVSFEDRLKLENAVRDINDEQVFSTWQAFTNSTDDRESQSAVGNLLKLLFSKIYK